MAKAKLGLGHAAMRTLYKGLFEPITTYAAAGWSNLLNGKTKNMLIESQRMALLQVTKAYKTSSTKALQVIAGVIPIDLLIEVRARIYEEKRGQDEASLTSITYQPASKIGYQSPSFVLLWTHLHLTIIAYTEAMTHLSPRRR